MTKRTVYSLLEEAVAAYGEVPALHQPEVTKQGRRYRTYSWVEYRDVVREIACGLRALGVEEELAHTSLRIGFGRFTTSTTRSSPRTATRFFVRKS